MPEPVRAALYLRLARDDTPGLRLLAAQYTAVRAAAEALGWHVVAVFYDIGSGTSLDRPGLQTMLAAARARRFDVVVVHNITRLARTLPGLVDILGELRHAGVNLRSATETFDTASNVGAILVDLLGAFAQLEHEALTDPAIQAPDQPTGPAPAAPQQPDTPDEPYTARHAAKPARVRRFTRLRRSRSGRRRQS